MWAPLVVACLMGSPERAALPCCSAALSDPWQTTDTIAAIQVHGNLATPDDEVRQIAGLESGTLIESATLADAAERLRASGRFKSVQVLKRYASISNPSQILVVIIVDEGAVRIEMTGDPAHPTRVVRSRRPRLLVLPVLGAEDGYGATYGVQFALPDPAGARSRLAFPVTWGGSKRAAAEFEKALENKPIDHVYAGGSISRRTNPFFGEDDDRVRGWIRAEREITRPLRIGASAGWQRVVFGGREDRFAYGGADAVFDTRVDPALPRNAVYGRAAWEHVGVDGGVNRLDLDGRGYVGLFGQTIGAVRVQRRDADRPLPPYLQPLLGGVGNLRGFAVGTAAGDTLVASSAELLVPLNSPLKIAKVGVSAFVDAATVYSKGQRFADQTLRQGYGASVWFTAAFLRLNLAVAHGRGATTRVHFGGDISF